jgi:hypothetical protein
MQDTRIDSLRATALPELDVTDLVGGIASTRMVVLIDACFSASTANIATKSLVDLNRIYPQFDGKGRVVISSSNGSQLSLVIDDSKHPGHGYSVFSWHLMEGLQGQADTDKDGVITVDEVWDFVGVRVPVTARKLKGDMSPQLKGQLGAKFLFSVDANRILQKQRDKQAELSKQRIQTLRDLALDEKITADQFHEAKRILSAMANITERDRQALDEYLAVIEGRLAPEKLGNALALIPNQSDMATKAKHNESDIEYSMVTVKATLIGPSGFCVGLV